MKSPYRTTLHNGQAWSAVLGAGRQLHLESLNSNPNVSMLLYNADQPLERYNMPDTLKGQHISKLSVGSCLHSDMGRLLASVVDSNLDWHDPLCGLIDESTVESRWGQKPYCTAHNGCHQNGRSNMLKEVGKHGLGKRDLVPAINLFSKVFVGDDGIMHYQEHHASTGSYVTLRMEMNTLVILSNTAHPMSTAKDYPGGDIQLTVSQAEATDPSQDICYQSRPENHRAWENTRDYMMMRG